MFGNESHAAFFIFSYAAAALTKYVCNRDIILYDGIEPAQTSAAVHFRPFFNVLLHKYMLIIHTSPKNMYVCNMYVNTASLQLLSSVLTDFTAGQRHIC